MSTSSPVGAARADDQPTTRSNLFAVVGAGLLWGTGGLTGALLGARTGLTPLAVSGYRLALGGTALVVLLLATGALRTLVVGIRARTLPVGRVTRRIVTIGLLAGFYQACYFGAVAVTTVGLATLITLGSAPVLVVVAEATLTGRRPSRSRLLAVAVAVAGLVLLVGVPGADTGDPVLGALLALGSAAGFAAITLISRNPVPGLTATTTTALSFTVGGAVLLLVCTATIGLPGVPVDAGSLLLLGYLGLVPTALAYVLFFTGLRTVRAGTAALIALLEPLTAALLGTLVLGERLGTGGLVGAALVATAVALCRRE